MVIYYIIPYYPTHLLHLELDGALEVLDLGLHVVRVGQQGGELASLVQAGTQQTGNLEEGVKNDLVVDFGPNRIIT